MWVEAGFDPESYWRQTPRLYDIAIRARIRVREQEQQGRAWLAWHVAALPKMKRFPGLKELLGQRPKARVQTPSRIEAELKRMFGLKRNEPWPVAQPSAPCASSSDSTAAPSPTD
ncbi:hypothetical protein GCM10017620_24620 [Brevundimonas intermedia]|uniref:Uncharacterized protein n=1 Tax=Brevundimonas intermedia TaxID=74315 RepID=A0ABQ5T9K7_9CAUL|nr:hypothetical protein [Brevundimonas intermedia]GLK49489.1 hypothetical protein GCM10017620_24620 [Brevundimonas intermedia]